VSPLERDAHGYRWSSSTGVRTTTDEVAGALHRRWGRVPCRVQTRSVSWLRMRVCACSDPLRYPDLHTFAPAEQLGPPTATMAAARVHPEQLSSMSQGPSQLAAAIKRGDAARVLALLEGMGAPTLLQSVECPWGGGSFRQCPKCSGSLTDDDRAVKLDVLVPSPLGHRHSRACPPPYALATAYLRCACQCWH